LLVLLLLLLLLVGAGELRARRLDGAASASRMRASGQAPSPRRRPQAGHLERQSFKPMDSSVVRRGRPPRFHAHLAANSRTSFEGLGERAALKLKQTVINQRSIG